MGCRGYLLLIKHMSGYDKIWGILKKQQQQQQQQHRNKRVEREYYYYR